MERHTKRAGGYLGLCCVFMVFVCVSSVNFYNPKYYIIEIGKLLSKLHHDLTSMNTGDITVYGPRTRDVEHGKNCAGTFLDIFQDGTKDISNLVLSHSVTHLTDSIDDCVTKLRRDCKKIQEPNPECNDSKHKENIVKFVEGFWNFSNHLNAWHICRKNFNQQYDLSEEYDPDKMISFCGTH